MITGLILLNPSWITLLKSLSLKQLPPDQKKHLVMFGEHSKKLLRKKKKSNTQNNSSQVMKQNLQKELSIFFNDDLLELEKSPFDCWKNNRRKYPNIAKLAQIYLSIPATSVSSERLFSKAGLVITNRRACLEPNFAEQPVLLGHNLKQ